MNDCEWWRAESLEAAIATMVRECGMSREDVLEGEPHELTEEDLDQLKYQDWEPEAEEPAEGWPTRTFRQQLKIEDDAGLPAGIFACTSDCF